MRGRRCKMADGEWEGVDESSVPSKTIPGKEGENFPKGTLESAGA